MPPCWAAPSHALFFWFAIEDLTGFSTLGFDAVFALASGGVLLGERLQLLQWFSVVLVLLSVLLVSQATLLGTLDLRIDHQS